MKDSDSKVLFYRPNKWIVGFYIFIIICLFLYSFTQVDLGLTMTRVSSLTQIQRAFQWVGYFNRPLSTLLAILIMVALFKFYILFIFFARKKIFEKKTFWKIIFILAAVLTFSYTAYSYDIFNYIFDAKIVTHYSSNPYLHKALDYPGDPMLSFMRWTHRTYPYGPVWLGLTIPLSFIGLNYFIPTYFLFKALTALSYIGSIWLIGKIMRSVAPKKELLAQVIFALNPLVIIEVLVSGHNDISMMFFALASLLYLIRKKYFFAFSLLLISIGIKYATGFLLPMYIMIYLFEKKKIMVPWATVFLTMVVAMVLAVIAASLKGMNFQPWYFLFVLPFAALAADTVFVLIPTIILSLAFLANYIPYFYTGNWDPPIPFILLTLNIAAAVISLVFCLVVFYTRKKTRKVSSALFA